MGDNTVQYDLNTNKDKITLAGQQGTTITNVKSALDGAKDADGKKATIATATGNVLKNAKKPWRFAESLQRCQCKS